MDALGPQYPGRDDGSPFFRRRPVLDLVVVPESGIVPGGAVTDGVVSNDACATCHGDGTEHITTLERMLNAGQLEEATRYNMTAIIGLPAEAVDEMAQAGFIPLIPVANELQMPLIGNGSLAPVRSWNPWAYRCNTISAVATPALLRGLIV